MFQDFTIVKYLSLITAFQMYREMASQSIWIVITIGVFFVGLAVGFGVFSNSMHIGNMPMQNQQQMMNDPTFQQQMMTMMMQNQDMMNSMMDGQMMMEGNMMGSGMMNQDMMMNIMQDPETREKMISIMSKHADEMQELLSSDLTDNEFDIKMTELMQKHMDEMQDLMQSQTMMQPMN